LKRKFSAFPKDCCGHASVLLALYLRDEGFADVRYVYNGRRSPDSHAWVEVGGIIVDITADQFTDNPNAVIVTEERSWHSRFSGEQRRSEILGGFADEAKQNYENAYAAVKNRLPCERTQPRSTM
jgi:hypothetical protein